MYGFAQTLLVPILILKTSCSVAEGELFHITFDGLAPESNLIDILSFPLSAIFEYECVNLNYVYDSLSDYELQYCVYELQYYVYELQYCECVSLNYEYDSLSDYELQYYVYENLNYERVRL